MIFVTGGTGLVGSHILLKLSQQGKNFRALKRGKSSLKVCEKVFKYYNAIELYQKINWVEGDILDLGSLEETIQGYKYRMNLRVVNEYAWSMDLLQHVFEITSI